MLFVLAINAAGMMDVQDTQNSKAEATYAINAAEEHPRFIEKFYIFDVGQGNSQLAIYNDIGILYDCGSMSKFVSNKVNELQTAENSLLFPSKISIEATHKLQEKTASKPYEEIGFGDLNIPELTEDRNSHDTVSSTTGDRSAKLSVEEKIKKIINSAKLKHLIVFLSHPDFDHYNMLVNALPDELPITVFLCGDWLGGDDVEQVNGSKSSQYTHQIQILHKLSVRKNTWIELPYYWEYVTSDNTEKLKNYEDIINSLKPHNLPTEPSNIKDAEYKCFKATYLKKPFSNNNIFQGNLLTLIRKVQKKCSREDIKEHFSDLLDEGRDNVALGNTFIWIMNQASTDANAQSTVVSFTMPTLNAIFTCTGDITHDVFVNNYNMFINSSSNDKYLKSIDLLNVLIGPHHGSSKNLSLLMLDVFSPNIIIFSSGDGIKEKHPDKRTINYNRSYLTKNMAELKFINFFDTDTQNRQKPLSGIYFSDPPNTSKKRSKKENMLPETTMLKNDIDATEQNSKPIPTNHLFEFSKKSPILCTNLLGTIVFAEDGISCSFSDLILGENPNIIARPNLSVDVKATYRVNLKQSIPEPIEASPAEYYFKVPSKRNGFSSFKFYTVEKISNGFTPITNQELSDNEDEQDVLAMDTSSEQWDIINGDDES